MCSYVTSLGDLFSTIGCFSSPPRLSILDLQQFLESHSIKPLWRDLHTELLRSSKLRQAVNENNWERALCKFFRRYFPHLTATIFELERFNYAMIPAAHKLLVLRLLLETQFDFNTEMRAQVNSLTCDSIRPQPLGCSLFGERFFSFIDGDCNVRVFVIAPPDASEACHTEELFTFSSIQLFELAFTETSRRLDELYPNYSLVLRSGLVPSRRGSQTIVLNVQPPVPQPPAEVLVSANEPIKSEPIKSEPTKCEPTNKPPDASSTADSASKPSSTQLLCQNREDLEKLCANLQAALELRTSLSSDLHDVKLEDKETHQQTEKHKRGRSSSPCKLCAVCKRAAKYFNVPTEHMRPQPISPPPPVSPSSRSAPHAHAHPQEGGGAQLDVGLASPRKRARGRETALEELAAATGGDAEALGLRRSGRARKPVQNMFPVLLDIEFSTRAPPRKRAAVTAAASTPQAEKRTKSPHKSKPEKQRPKSRSSKRVSSDDEEEEEQSPVKSRTSGPSKAAIVLDDIGIFVTASLFFV